MKARETSLFYWKKVRFFVHKCDTLFYVRKIEAERKGEKMFFEEEYDRHLALATDLWEHPELGFKEHYTRQRILDYLTEVTPDLEVRTFAHTGIRVDLNHGKDHTMVFLAEMDSVYSPAHWQADPETGAAQACGHFTQVTIALSIYRYYVQTEAYKQLDFNVAFIFVPAEEYVDLDYRRQLRDQGELVYLGGKAEAMREGVFDDVDFVYHLHALGEEHERPIIEVACDLAGFCYKYFTFKGKASHAGLDPFSGINAYSMSTLFNTALGLSRQQMREDKYLRINPVLFGENTMTTNVIPHEVKIGTDIRSMSLDYMKEISKRLDQMAKGSAQALGGEVVCETEMGYLPFIQDAYLTKLVKEAFEADDTIPDIIDDRGAIAAAGDIGDLSFMVPSIQISYGGFEGRIHGADFKMVDSEFVLSTLPAFLVKSIQHISDNVDYRQFYHRSFQEYAKVIADMMDN